MLTHTYIYYRFISIKKKTRKKSVQKVIELMMYVIISLQQEVFKWCGENYFGVWGFVFVFDRPKTHFPFLFLFVLFGEK